MTLVAPGSTAAGRVGDISDQQQPEKATAPIASWALPLFVIDSVWCAVEPTATVPNERSDVLRTIPGTTGVVGWVVVAEPLRISPTMLEESELRATVPVKNPADCGVKSTSMVEVPFAGTFRGMGVATE